MSEAFRDAVCWADLARRSMRKADDAISEAVVNCVGRDEGDALVKSGIVDALAHLTKAHEALVRARVYLDLPKPEEPQ